MNTSDDHELALAEALVDLADTLIDDYDVIELLNRLAEHCVRLLPVDAAGLVLSDQRGLLRVVSSSTGRPGVLELFESAAESGPCVESFRSGQPVAVADLGEPAQRWPRFARHAMGEGFHFVLAVPMRLRSETIGALTVVRGEPGPLSQADLRIGRALAGMATIGLLHEQAVRRADVLAEQLPGALNSRIVVEQAKGVLAGRSRLGMTESFALLRGYARATNQRLSDLSLAVVEDITIADRVLRSTTATPSRRGDDRQP